MSIDPAFGRSVPWLIDTWARRRPDHPFLVWVPFDGPAQTWTYAALPAIPGDWLSACADGGSGRAIE